MCDRELGFIDSWEMESHGTGKQNQFEWKYEPLSVEHGFFGQLREQARGVWTHKRP